MKPSLLLTLAAAALAPAAAQAASLEATTSAGDSAGVVATCLKGSNAADPRGCTDLIAQSPLVSSATVLSSASWATYPTSFYSQAAASAALGTLRAMAQTSIPLSDAGFHNLQSHAIAEMRDSLIASSSLGTLFNNYQYNVNITGFATPSNGTYDLPSIKSDTFVQIDIRVENTGEVLASKHWETSASSLGGGSITGMIGGVAANTQLALDLYIQSESGIVTSAAGQSGFAEADYSSTVHFYLDALTPGANTVSLGGMTMRRRCRSRRVGGWSSSGWWGWGCG